MFDKDVKSNPMTKLHNYAVVARLLEKSVNSRDLRTLYLSKHFILLCASLEGIQDVGLERFDSVFSSAFAGRALEDSAVLALYNRTNCSPCPECETD